MKLNIFIAKNKVLLIKKKLIFIKSNKSTLNPHIQNIITEYEADIADFKLALYAKKENRKLMVLQESRII